MTISRAVRTSSLDLTIFGARFDHRRLALSLLLASAACRATPPADPAPHASPTASAPATEGGAPGIPTATTPPPAPEAEPFGTIDRWDPALDAIVPVDWKIEKIAEGFAWAEGPLWIASGGYLLFTDVPGNTRYKWSDPGGLEVYLKPSGLERPDPKVTREAGLNGLCAEADSSILAADSGNRTVVRLDLATKKKTPLASAYQGRRFNSPNDLCRRSDGTVYFTDPPYGLAGIDDSPAKELSFNGVYRLDANGAVTLIDDQLKYPNGIALSPDQRTLYVANTDREHPIWMAYSLDEAGNVEQKRVFADATDLVQGSAMGAPDGLAVAADGTLFATAPGGVLVLSPSGKRLGRIATGKPIANCTFGDDGRTLYMTSQDLVARIRLNTVGQGFPKP